MEFVFSFIMLFGLAAVPLEFSLFKKMVFKAFIDLLDVIHTYSVS